MVRPFVIIPYLPTGSFRWNQSALIVKRIETHEDEIKAKRIKNLIKTARKLDLGVDVLEALYAEYKPYFYLHMTQRELSTLKAKLREVGLYASFSNFNEYGMNFAGSKKYVISDVADPVAALQSALEAINETVLFTGVVKIEYQDNHESKFLNVRNSVVIMADEDPR